MVSNAEYQALASRLVELEKRMDGVSGPQLGRSSLENAGINSYVDGKLSGRVGTQYDGANGFVAFNGPKPPIPAWSEEDGPAGEPVAGAVRYRWEGNWIQTAEDAAANRPTVAPTNFVRVELHTAAEIPDNLIDFSTLRTTIGSPRGGETAVIGLTSEQQYAWLVARTSDGQASDASTIIGPFTPAKVQPDEIEIDFSELGGNEIFSGPDTPTGTQRQGNLWLKEVSTDSNGVKQYETRRWDGDSWELVPDQRVSAALAQAISANNAAVQAGNDALAASGAASAAQGTANGAQTKAQQAADAAAAAQSAANLAKTAADSRVTLYRQSAAPSGGTYRTNDLWIDTDDGKIYAWTGSWTLSDDQRIATALSTATSASTAVATKVTVFAQISAPTTTGRTTGDIWLDTDDGNRRYVWTGSWTASPIGATGISATARQLGAITTYRQATAPASGMIVGDFWIDSDDNVIYRYEGTTPAWVKSQDVNINAAITAAATAQATADGKMQIYTQPSQPAALTAADVGDMWIDTDDGNKVYTWAPNIGTGAPYMWTPRQLGNSAIQPQSLIASNVIATGTVSAALLEAVMLLGNTLVIGNPTGDRITISGINATAGVSAGVGIQQVTNGKVTFQLSPGGGAYFAGTLTGQSANYVEATAGWRVAETGDASFQRLQAFDSITTRNLSVSTLTVAGQSLQNVLDVRPRGLQQQGYTDVLNIQNVTAETGLVELGFTAQPGRGYLINVNGGQFASSDMNTVIGFLMRYTVDGSAPNVNSTMQAPLGHMYAGPTPEGQYISRTLDKTFLWYPTSALVPVPIRLALSFYRERGGGSVGCNTTGIRLQMSAIDIGPALPNAIRINNFTAASPPPAPAAPVQSYTDTFYSTWGCSYRTGGAAWSLNEQGWAYQGYGDSFNGDQISLHGFDLVAIRSRLAGANIKSATFYARAGHTWNTSGGVMLLGTHGNDQPPGSGDAITALQERRSTTAIQSGGWAGVDCTGAFAEIRNATASGFTFGRAGNNDPANYTYYYQYPHPDRPRVVVTWEK